MASGWWAIIGVSVAFATAGMVLKEVNKPEREKRESERVAQIVSDSRYLEGEERSHFLKTNVTDCITTQKSLPDNARITEQVIGSYCTCLMTAYVDSFVARELRRPVGELRNAHSLLIDRLRENCAKKAAPPARTSAFTPSSPFVGRGDNRCDQTLAYLAKLDERRRAEAELQIQSWIDGYLSRANNARKKSKRELLDLWSSQKVSNLEFIVDYCKTFPAKLVGDGVEQIVFFLGRQLIDRPLVEQKK